MQARAAHRLRTGLAILVVLILDLGRALHVVAGCNVIPSLERSYQSTSGAIDVPFARPGQVVTITRADAVFSDDPSQNTVSITFSPVGGPSTEIAGATVLPPLEGSACPPSKCAGGNCTCVRFEFPNTDAQVAAPDDGRTLTGPASITVTTGVTTTAVIGPLIDADTGVVFGFTPSFTALPPPTDFSALTATPGADVLAAPDIAGDLFVPVSYAGLIHANRAQIIEATIGALALIPEAVVDSLTPEGAILPPFVRRIGAEGLIGTVDAPEVVLRLPSGQYALALSQIEGKGPVVIAGVEASADPHKDVSNLFGTLEGQTVAFESHECGPYDPIEVCTDLNGDGDASDYFLKVLDLSVPQATPQVVDEFDGADLAGFPADLPPIFYQAQVSDHLIAFRAVESAWDANGNGAITDVLRTGAYDVARATRVPLADDSPRMDMSESLLAFSVPEDPVNGPDRLYVYEATLGDPGPVGLVDLATEPSGAVIPLNRDPDYTQELGWFPGPLLPAGEVDLTAANGFVAAMVDEEALGHDVNGDEIVGGALTFFDMSGTTVANSFRFTGPTAIGRHMQINDRWLTFEFYEPSYGRRIMVVDRSNLLAPASYICGDTSAVNALVARMSEDIIPCVRRETNLLGQGHDRNGDGDADDWVMHVFLPNDAGGPTELDLGLASAFAGQAIGALFLFTVDEVAQNADLDGDGLVGPPPEEPVFEWPVLHGFNAHTKRTTNFRLPTLFNGSAAKVQRGYAFAGGSAVDVSKLHLYFLRDLDGDDSFEDRGVDVATGRLALNDNCPTVANPDQADGDGDGIGDACDPIIDVPVIGKLTVVDTHNTTGRASVVYRAAQALTTIAKGPGTDLGDVAVEVTISYDGANGSTSGRFTVPAGAYDGIAGWKVNKSTLASYANKEAPDGTTGAKSAQIKPGKALKLVGKNLGDVPLDLATAGVPAGPITVQFAVTSGGKTYGHCSRFDPANVAQGVRYQAIAGGAGRKLTAKNGTPIVCP